MSAAEMAKTISAMVRAQATWKLLSAKQSEYTAAVLMGETERALEIRDEAHRLLDENLDANGAVASATVAQFG